MGPHPPAKFGSQQLEAVLTCASSGSSLSCQQPVVGGCGIEQVHPIPQNHTGSCPCFHRGRRLPGGKLLPLLCEWVLARCLWLLHLLGSDRSISWPLPERAAAGLWLQLAGRWSPLNWQHCSRRLSGSLLGAAVLAGGQGLLQILLQLLPTVIQAVLHLLHISRHTSLGMSSNLKQTETMLQHRGQVPAATLRDMGGGLAGLHLQNPCRCKPSLRPDGGTTPSQLQCMRQASRGVHVSPKTPAKATRYKILSDVAIAQSHQASIEAFTDETITAHKSPACRVERKLWMNWGCRGASSNREAWPAGSLRADSRCVRARIAWLDSLQSSTCSAARRGMTCSEPHGARADELLIPDMDLPCNLPAHIHW